MNILIEEGDSLRRLPALAKGQVAPVSDGELKLAQTDDRE